MCAQHQRQAEHPARPNCVVNPGRFLHPLENKQQKQGCADCGGEVRQHHLRPGQVDPQCGYDGIYAAQRG